ncbi:MAG TPA: arsenate reductase ArsC, partial [Lamprocystis sp. (in: g-proteobacteria)]|nr:arsenate reductase ArsC [Lamprocystis sp. (in: g-proteobacteria)]
AAHWGSKDLAAVAGDDLIRLNAFRTAFREIENRIRIFVALPFAALDRHKLQHELNQISTL